jgi:hypothetical protein
MADLTQFYSTNYYQWELPGAENPRLSAPISSSATSITVTNALKDEDGSVVPGDFILGIKDSDGYTENCFCPSGTLNYDAQTANFTAGKILTGGTSGATAYIVSDSDSGTTGTLTLAFVSGTFQNDETITDNNSTPGSATSNGTLTNSVSADGLTISNVVRGIDLGGLDITTNNTAANAVAHDQDDPVRCAIAAGNFELMVGAMRGTVASGGNQWKIGRDVDEDITVFAANGDANLPAWKYDADAGTGGEWQYSNDGVTFQPFGDGSGLLAGNWLTITSGTIDFDRNEIQDQSAVFAADAEASDTYVITLTPAPSAYATGQRFSFSANTANTGAATLNVNALGAKTIKRPDGNDLETGDIVAGQHVTVEYDGTNFQMVSASAATINPSLTNGSDASTLHNHDIAANSFASTRVQLISGWNASTASSGTVADVGGGVHVQTGATTGLTANTYMTTLDSEDVSSKSPKHFSRVAFSQTTNQDGLIGLYNTSVSSGHNGTLTTDHAAFLIADAAIYASVADGATQSKSADLSGTYPVTAMREYYILESGGNYLFYIDGNLVHTSSGNEPNSGLFYSTNSVRAAANEAKTIKIYQHVLTYDE